MNITIICYKDILNSVQNYFFYKIVNEDSDLSKDEMIDWDSFCERVGKRIDEYTIYITEKPFSDN